jgi:uncharacterized HAD superfamily protein
MYHTIPNKIIAIDFDDVIFDLNGPLTEWHNREHGTAIKYEDIIDFHLEKIFAVQLSEIIKRLDVFRTHHWDTMTLVAGAEQALVELKNTHPLHVVTARCESLMPITEQMVDAHLPGLFSKVHYTNGFTALNQDKRRSKVDVCREIGAQLMIDDNPYQAEEFASSGVTLLVPDRPWNQVSLPEGVIRCGSWRKPGSCWSDVMTWIISNP